MKKTVLILFALIFGLSIHSQSRRRNNSVIPETNREPTEQEIAKREREIEERKEEYIDNFLLTLEGDEFQKHITKQNINSFLDARLVILKAPYEHYLDRVKALENLKESHFKDLKELISESDMTKVTELINGKFDEKEVAETKKEKRKKRKQKKDKS
ncbi:hypothetical protein [Winogradskyella ludwigii]|jgi:hypothetical protein|uniref:hypothetical protein n=1 Tax=Winogradskyella ludwigii TaxID=2686076 RepID=UPI0015CB0E16|nr:hypothetical protein [Winogradskyella ludwigii]